mmetsp:Transcript_14326/g.30619  ORF Transcript_14326/g.30619 Transcript_14326/m.30619 type:complete len:151 (+) Transcript_14326:174-626(+)
MQQQQANTKTTPFIQAIPTMTVILQRNSYYQNEVFPIVTNDAVKNSSQYNDDAEDEIAAFFRINLRKSSNSSLASLPNLIRLPKSKSTPKLPPLKLGILKKTTSEDSMSSISSLCNTVHPRRKSYKLRQKNCLKHLNEIGCRSNPFVSKG